MQDFDRGYDLIERMIAGLGGLYDDAATIAFWEAAKVERVISALDNAENAICDGEIETWLDRALEVLDSITNKKLEMRAREFECDLFDIAACFDIEL